MLVDRRAIYFIGAFMIGATALVVRRRLTARMQHAHSSSDAALGKLWASVVEVMLCSKQCGVDVHLTPNESRPAGALNKPLPAAFSGAVIFALTAFDPPGHERTLEANTAANGELFAAIKELSPVSHLHTTCRSCALCLVRLVLVATN